MDESHFLACPSLSFGDQFLQKVVIRHCQFGAVGREYAVEAGLAVVVQMDVSMIVHGVVHVPDAVHASTDRTVQVTGRSHQVDG